VAGSCRKSATPSVEGCAQPGQIRGWAPGGRGPQRGRAGGDVGGDRRVAAKSRGEGQVKRGSIVS
jgi:hypothetical protein